MYARYNYTNTQTRGGLIDDVVKILTGETNTANLTSGCNTVDSLILNTYANAGWTLDDSVAISSPAWIAGAVSFLTVATGTFSMTNGSHNLVANDEVQFEASTMPTGLSAGVTYYVMSTVTATLFRVSASAGDGGGTLVFTGSAVNLSYRKVTKAATFYKNAHGLLVGDRIRMTTNSQFVGGFAIDTDYYVESVPTAALVTLSATRGGAGIIASSATTSAPTFGFWTNQFQVLKAPLADDGAQFKYVMLALNASTHLQLHLYETWNATTHTGTNPATAWPTTQQQQISLGNTASSLNIAASARFIAMQSIINGGTIGASSVNEWTGVFERTRLAPWDTPAAGYPPTLITVGSCYGLKPALAAGMYGAHACRWKDINGLDVTGVNAFIYPCAMGWTGEEFNAAYTTNTPIGASLVSWTPKGASSIMHTKVPDGLGGYYTPFTEIQFRRGHYQYSFEGGSISDACDVWVSVSYPNNLDEVIKDGKTYIFWQNTRDATGITATSDSLGGQASANSVFPKG